MTFVGHATILVETGGTRILTDPVLRDRVVHLSRLGPVPPVDGLLRPDAVLISHVHHDHLDLPSLRKLPAGAGVVAPPGSTRLVRRGGPREVTELRPGESARVDGVRVTATEAMHSARRPPLAASARAVGYVLEGRHRIYFAGDTDLFDGMRDIAGDLDLALLPVWGWGASLPPGHLDPERAARAAAMLRPRIAVPIHWGTYASRSGRLPDPERPAREFAQLAAEHAPGVDVRVLRVGDSLRLD